MKSAVYFMNLRATPKQNLLNKLEKMIVNAGIDTIIKKKELAAIKIHFGELGNAAYVRPIYIRRLVDYIKKLEGIPFITDANTLYAGSRSDTPTHLATAIQNGFDYAVVNAPLVIADGLRGRTETSIRVNQKHCKTVHIGKEICEADSLISVAHFKGHEITGFGGTLKNIGMGCASRRGKMEQHSTVSPKISKKKCIGCGDCISHCSQKAISMGDDKKAQIDATKCIGCGECILICLQSAVDINWNQDSAVLMEKMVEHAYGIIKEKNGKCFYINFITNVSPACDCYGYNDASLVADIGVVASKDPVAIDQASVDLVNKEHGNKDSCLKSGLNPGEDKFKAVYPKIDWAVQLDYAQKLEMGSRDYELISVD